MMDEPRRPRRADRRHSKRLHTPQEIRGVGPSGRSRKPQGTLQPRKRSAALDPAMRRRRRGRIAIIIGVILACLLVAGGIAAFAFIRNIDTKIHPVALDSGFANQLAQQAPPAGDPFYMLLLGTDRRPGTVTGNSDTLIVARIDPKQRKVELLSIMRDSRVNIPGHGMFKINAAYSMGGVELALKTVRQLTGLPITKYLTVDFSGFSTIVNAMGGVWVNVPEEIDGIPAGSSHTKWQIENRIIHKGYQKLNGAQALTFVRARHQFANQDYTRVADQQLFLRALMKQGLSASNVFSAPKIIDAVASNMSTNMSLTELANLVLQFKGMKDKDFETATAPSTPQYIGGISYVVIDTAKFDAMLARMDKGQPLELTTQTATGGSTTTTSAPAVKPADITLTIRNGAGVSGLAKIAATYFTSKGFHVVTTGNANQYVYGQTLIVYGKSTEAKAGPVADALGYGKVIPSAGMYSFSTDILLVIGKDWKNPSAR